MRQDQYLRLQELSEKLMDVFLTEADPDKWPGAGIPLAQMDQKTRGDLYWCKKVAAGTITLFMKTTNLQGRIQMGGIESGAPDAEEAQEAEDEGLDSEIARAEKEAQKMLAEIQSGAKKAAFDKKVHGK